MPEQDSDQPRDKLLLRLLKTPPQPRPKRERDKDKATRKVRERRATAGKPAPTA